MSEEPNATVSITAERVGSIWSLYCVPDKAHTDDDRVLLASGPDGAGVTFPLALIERFYEGQQNG